MSIKFMDRNEYGTEKSYQIDGIYTLQSATSIVSTFIINENFTLFKMV